jgi:hypothetical protein
MYESGKTDTVSGTDSLYIEAEEYTDVSVEAFLEDPAGNRGSVSVFNFVIDPVSVYLSAAGEEGGAETGGRDAPFRSLDRALEFCLRESRGRILMNGAHTVSESLIIDGDIRIDGAWDENWRPGPASPVVIPAGVSLTVNGGTLELRGLAIQRRDGTEPFLYAAGGNVSIETSSVTCRGAFLTAKGGAVGIAGSRVVSLPGASGRLPALAAAGAALRLSNSSFTAEGTHTLFLDMKDGSLDAETCSFALNGGRTGTLFRLEGTRGTLNGIDADITAADYSCALDITTAVLTVEGGKFFVTARDAAAFVTDNSSSVFLRTLFRVDAAFAARAMDIRGIFPHVTECGFVFAGNARRADVFAAGALLPAAGTIAANVFEYCTHILGDVYPVESLAGFNRAFAPPGRPNAALNAPRRGSGR